MCLRDDIPTYVPSHSNAYPGTYLSDGRYTHPPTKPKWLPHGHPTYPVVYPHRYPPEDLGKRPLHGYEGGLGVEDLETLVQLAVVHGVVVEVEQSSKPLVRVDEELLLPDQQLHVVVEDLRVRYGAREPTIQ